MSRLLTAHQHNWATECHSRCFTPGKYSREDKNECLCTPMRNLYRQPRTVCKTIPIIRACAKYLKYADDTTLLVPQNSPTTLEVELSHILQWSSTNKLKLSTLKTKEIVFHRPRLPNRTLPPLFPGIERVSSAKILGLTFTATLSPEQHINNIIAIGNQRLYLLSQLKQQNLSEQALDLIFYALIISKITYALPAFAGHISTAERNRINKFFRKAYRRHLVTQIFDIT